MTEPEKKGANERSQHLLTATPTIFFYDLVIFGASATSGNRRLYTLQRTRVGGSRRRNTPVIIPSDEVLHFPLISVILDPIHLVLVQ